LVEVAECSETAGKTKGVLRLTVSAEIFQQEEAKRIIDKEPSPSGISQVVSPNIIQYLLRWSPKSSSPVAEQISLGVISGEEIKRQTTSDEAFLLSIDWPGNEASFREALKTGHLSYTAIVAGAKCSYAELTLEQQVQIVATALNAVSVHATDATSLAKAKDSFTRAVSTSLESQLKSYILDEPGHREAFASWVNSVATALVSKFLDDKTFQQSVQGFLAGGSIAASGLLNAQERGTSSAGSEKSDVKGDTTRNVTENESQEGESSTTDHMVEQSLEEEVGVKCPVFSAGAKASIKSTDRSSNTTSKQSRELKSEDITKVAQEISSKTTSRTDRELRRIDGELSFGMSDSVTGKACLRFVHGSPGAKQTRMEGIAIILTAEDADTFLRSQNSTEARSYREIFKQLYTLSDTLGALRGVGAFQSKIEEDLLIRTGGKPEISTSKRALPGGVTLDDGLSTKEIEGVLKELAEESREVNHLTSDQRRRIAGERVTAIAEPELAAHIEILRGNNERIRQLILRIQASRPGGPKWDPDRGAHETNEYIIEALYAAKLALATGEQIVKDYHKRNKGR
jgi:hypothetical protein